MPVTISPIYNIYIYIYEYRILFFPSNVHLCPLTYFNVKCLISHLAVIIWINPLSYESQQPFKWTQFKLNLTSILVEVLHLGWLTMWLFFTLLFCHCRFILHRVWPVFLHPLTHTGIDMVQTELWLLELMCITLGLS